jgi:hypothetical protein
MEVIADSLKNSITVHPPASQQRNPSLEKLSSDIADFNEGLNKANETMDSLVKHQIMTIASFPIKNNTSKMSLPIFVRQRPQRSSI